MRIFSSSEKKKKENGTGRRKYYKVLLGGDFYVMIYDSDGVCSLSPPLGPPPDDAPCLPNVIVFSLCMSVDRICLGRAVGRSESRSD
jgi:hypothetical protein